MSHTFNLKHILILQTLWNTYGPLTNKHGNYISVTVQLSHDLTLVPSSVLWLQASVGHMASVFFIVKYVQFSHIKRSIMNSSEPLIYRNEIFQRYIDWASKELSGVQFVECLLVMWKIMLLVRWYIRVKTTKAAHVFKIVISVILLIHCRVVRVHTLYAYPTLKINGYHCSAKPTK